jgi:hypothetical protein
MMVLPTMRGSIYSSRPTNIPPPEFRSLNFVFYPFWDRETIINRYDSSVVTTTTTARGWFFR